jgi:long-chain acyl-CoA synthetase
MTSGGEIATTPRTIAELPFFASGRFPKPDTLGRATADGVQVVSAREMLDRVRDLGLGLGTLGVVPGDRVVVLAESRPEWVMADLAIITMGAITTPVYPTLGEAHVRAIVDDCAPRLAFASTAEQVAKLRAAATGFQGLAAIVAFDRAAVDEAGTVSGGPPVLALDDVAAAGHRQILGGWGIAREYHDAAKRIRPEDPATLIYTSGTTGTPKGVLLTHRNLVANIEGVCQRLDLRHDDTALSFLPLCHAFERTVSFVYLACGVSMIFAESTDTIARDLRAVRPTVMTGVPRVFEKLHARVLERGRTLPPPRRAIFGWGLGVADRLGRLTNGSGPGPWLAVQQRLAEKLVFAKVREGVGGRIRYVVSGGAALRPDIARFFAAIGVPILEGYGLTETAPVLCVTPLEGIRPGSVGPPLPNVELRVADDGEILVRGPNVMPGYFNRPDETAAVIRDGWLHTGDLGRIDADGYVTITDRKKEMLVTSSGKNIAPAAIESALKATGVIEEALVVAEGRHFVGALIVPAFAEIARRLGVAAPDVRHDSAAGRVFVSRPDVVALIQAAVDDVNAHLAQFEKIKRFALLASELTIASGELTPTLKVRRTVVEEKFRAEIDALYRD